MSARELAKLDPREQHFRIPSPLAGASLFLRHLPPAQPSRRVVLYVHGGTFPSALSIAHRFDGRSWRDELCDAGWHVWGLDFLGYGGSDPYPQMAEPASAHPPLGRAQEAALQIETATRFILGEMKVSRLSIVAHSWGTIAAGRFAGDCPELVDRLVFFGPIARRPKETEPAAFEAWRLVSLADQWQRFTAEVPAGEPPVLSRQHFDEWGERWLDTDPDSRGRAPASVKVPSGAWQDIAAAHAGDQGYDPARVRAPVAIIRGEWDAWASDGDAGRLFDSLTGSLLKRDVKIGRATHLMHLEAGRRALHRETETFLAGDDLATGGSRCSS